LPDFLIQWIKKSDEMLDAQARAIPGNEG